MTTWDEQARAEFEKPAESIAANASKLTKFGAPLAADHRRGAGRPRRLGRGRPRRRGGHRAVDRGRRGHRRAAVRVRRRLPLAGGRGGRTSRERDEARADGGERGQGRGRRKAARDRSAARRTPTRAARAESEANVAGPEGNGWSTGWCRSVDDQAPARHAIRGRAGAFTRRCRLHSTPPQEDGQSSAGGSRSWARAPARP